MSHYFLISAVSVSVQFCLTYPELPTFHLTTIACAIFLQDNIAALVGMNLRLALLCHCMMLAERHMLSIQDVSAILQVHDQLRSTLPLEKHEVSHRTFGRSS